jgi:hypothetical protein
MRRVLHNEPTYAEIDAPHEKGPAQRTHHMLKKIDAYIRRVLHK